MRSHQECTQLVIPPTQPNPTQPNPTQPNPTQPNSLVINSPFQETQDNFVIQSADDKRGNSLPYASDTNVEGNTFIASLNEMALPDNPNNDSYKCTEISKLAETIVLLNSRLHLECKRCDELKNENLVLRNKLF